MTKEMLVETVQHLPDEFSIDELIERLVLAEKIETGRRQYAEGKVMSHEEAREKLSKWLK